MATSPPCPRPPSSVYNKTTQLTFTSRRLYADGTPLNAERFAYSIRRNINPTTAGECAITDEIVGAPEWHACGESASGL